MPAHGSFGFIVVVVPTDPVLLELEPPPVEPPVTDLLVTELPLDAPAELPVFGAFTINIVPWLGLLRTESQTRYIPTLIVTTSLALLPLPSTGVRFATNPVPAIPRP
jgi:hypothetical protein